MISLLVFTIIEAPSHGWSSARSVAGFLIAASLLVGFVAWECRSRAPMLDVSLFRNTRFSAACAAVTVSFFTLLGFIFVITQYFQLIKHYSPLSAGVHLLPVAFSVGVSSVLGTKLAVRIGTKVVVTAGLLLVTAFYLWVATVSTTTGYATIATQMVVYGVGMGLTSAPATEAIMGVVPAAKAGVGSAVNDATRLLGGTLGVAVIGSVYASVYGSRLTAALPRGFSHGIASLAHSSAGAAFTVTEQLTTGGHAALAAAVHDAAARALVHGLSAGCLVAGAVALGGAVIAAALLPAQPIANDGAAPDISAADIAVRPGTQAA